MKKLIFTLALLLSCFAMNAQKQQINLGIKSGPCNPHSPGITVPFLVAEYDAEELTFSIRNYTGEVEVFILDEQEVQVYSDTMNVVGSDSLDIDLTSFPHGTYYLYIRLENDDLYEGTFDL